jgi:hypothetical protein
MATIILCSKERIRTYRFISLTREGNLLTILHTLLNKDLENLLLLHNLITLALWASIPITDGLPSSLAVVARLLHLLNHSRSQLPDLDLKTRALATSAPR